MSDCGCSYYKYAVKTWFRNLLVAEEVAKTTTEDSDFVEDT
jgi:hypothetical protein